MIVSSINSKTFTLTKKGPTTKIGAALSYDAITDTATLDPTNSLQGVITYKAVVTTGAKEVACNPLDQKLAFGWRGGRPEVTSLMRCCFHSLVHLHQRRAVATLLGVFRL